jgi:hypothetical protein
LIASEKDGFQPMGEVEGNLKEVRLIGIAILKRKMKEL